MELYVDTVARFTTVLAVLLSPFVSVTLILWFIFGSQFLELGSRRKTKPFQFRMIDSICLAVWVQLTVALIASADHRNSREMDLSTVLWFSSFCIAIIAVIWWRLVAYLERHDVRSSWRRGIAELVFAPLVVVTTVTAAYFICSVPVQLLNMWITETPRDDEAYRNAAIQSATLAIVFAPPAVTLLAVFHAWIINDPLSNRTREGRGDGTP